MGELLILETLSSNPTQLGIVLFILLLFLGEPLVLAVAFFASSHDYLDLQVVVVLTLISAIIAETFWFFIGRNQRVRSLFLNQHVQTVETLMQKVHLNKPLPLLFSTRLFTGLTIVAIIYLSSKGISFKRFLLFSTIVNTFWTPIVVLTGYSAGLGFNYALNLFNDIHLVSSIFLLAVLALYILYRLISRFWLKKLTLAQVPENTQVDNRK